ncbi:MAG: cyclic nucleotide-binding domain-containing protein [Elusimicrobia bacterium]|nr:cyclic nucleotide-binding domain-containing protein [Elusimicrobiota bacterium]MBP9127524.1 cyclic nucleotide-binding domain-containing protein [Elusimicrobiota bacterium]
MNSADLSADLLESPAPRRGLLGRMSARVRASVEQFLGDPVHRHKIRFFRGILLFKDLGRWDLARLVNRTMEKTYAPGDVVFQEGHLGRAFFIVAEGSVEVLRRNPLTDVFEPVAKFGPGDFFGEMVLLDELPRSATCRALETTRLHVLYKDHFDLLRAQSPRAAALILHALARLLSARLRRERRLPRLSCAEDRPVQ